MQRLGIEARWLASALLGAHALGCGAPASAPAAPSGAHVSPPSASSAAPLSASSAAPARNAPVASGSASPRPQPDVRPALGIGTDRAQLFLSSVAVHANGGAALVALSALGERDARAEQALSFDFQVTLPDGARFPLLAKRLPSARVESAHLRVPFRLPKSKPASKAAPGALAPSFVIDYDSPRFEPFATAFDAKLGATKDVLAIEKFVADYISTKSFGRRFDIASEVANSHTGDCTEHAVLLTAALRRRGIPSRVTLGVLFLFGTELVAFGHAWVEAEQHGETILLDAALRGVDSPERRLHYYPLAQLIDEGPGFSRAGLREPGLIHIQNITLELNRG